MNLQVKLAAQGVVGFGSIGSVGGGLSRLSEDPLTSFHGFLLWFSLLSLLTARSGKINGR